jgi:hypothetical protein
MALRSMRFLGDMGDPTLVGCFLADLCRPARRELTVLGPDNIEILAVGEIEEVVSGTFRQKNRARPAWA